MKYAKSSSVRRATLISLLLILGALMPEQSQAGVWGNLVASVIGAPGHQEDVVLSGSNLQTMPLPKPAMNADPMAGKGGGDIKIVDDTALVPDEGPSGTPADYEKSKNSTISVYVVRPGDTLSGIAQLFDVSPNTILWANDLPRGAKLKVGQTLTILPVTGVKYTVKKGDTLASVAKRFGGDPVEIASYNGIEDGSLVAGTEVIIPDGEVAVATPSAPKKTGVVPTVSKGTSAQIGYYAVPLSHYIKTQGVHGYNGVDLAAPVGTPLLASADGDVIIAKQSGWNGGYGGYIVIQHGNGSQTLYSHASRVTVSVGQHVSRGDVIGAVGATGKATGPHVHFEIRNGIRNPF